MFEIKTVEAPITAVNKQCLDENEGIWQVSIIVDAEVDGIHVKASTRFKVVGYNSIPYRQDYVTIKHDMQSNESYIVWEKEWL